MNGPYPIFVRLEGKTCVVVGGGQVAARKTRVLIDCGAEVTVIAPDVCAELSGLESDPRLTIHRKPFQPADLRGAFLVFAATNHRATNQRVAAAGRRLRCLVNSADEPTEGDFTVPATVTAGDITLAVSTRGRSPAFARRLREELAVWLSGDRAALLQIAAEVRAEVLASGVHAQPTAWASALEDERVVEALRIGDRGVAKRLLTKRLVKASEPTNSAVAQGSVDA